MHRKRGKHHPLPHHPRPLVRDLGAIVRERKRSRLLAWLGFA